MTFAVAVLLAIVGGALVALVAASAAIVSGNSASVAAGKRRRGFLKPKTALLLGLLAIAAAVLILGLAGKLLRPREPLPARAREPISGAAPRSSFDEQVTASPRGGQIVSEADIEFSRSADAAARKGIEWIIAHRGQYPEAFYFDYLRRYYRIAADDALARRLLKITGRSGATALKWTIDDLASDPGSRHWSALKAVILQAYQLKCDGKPYNDRVDRIQQVISAHEGEFFPPSMPANERIVAAFYLEKLGLRASESWNSLVRKVRDQALNFGPVERLSDDTMKFGYVLTHVVFTKSNYYSRYVPASEYAPEAKALKRCVKALLAKDLTDNEMDLAAELVAALKLLKQPIDGDVRALSSRLIEIQNSDGSWGSENPATDPTARIHHTGVAVSALIEFTAEPRKKDPWCDSEWR